jgi:DNA-binding XRE family transcriptional regulator/tetratricopeptide (TPR) repeat protein
VATSRRRYELAQRRKAVGHTQESFAEQLGIDRSTIVRWESGATEPLPWLRPKIARVLDISIDELDNIVAGPSRVLDGRAPKTPRGLTVGFTPSLPPSPGHAVLSNGDESVMHAFRAADKAIGGGHLYRTVVNYLHTTVAPQLFGGSANSSEGQLFASAAALTEMAGWMAHDAGKDGRADQHFRRSLDLATVGGDRQLTAHILGSMAHLAHHGRQPRKAIELASRGTQTLADAQPRLQARLLAMQARGYAALQQPQQCVDLLGKAESVLERTPTEAPSPWISHFDEGSLASESARCMRQVGDYQEAQRQAERVIALRPTERARSRAFGQLGLAAVYAAQGKPEEACAIARSVLEATESLSSYLVVQQLSQLAQLFTPYRHIPSIAEFLDCLETTLPRRLLPYQWLDNNAESTR